MKEHTRSRDSPTDGVALPGYLILDRYVKRLVYGPQKTSDGASVCMKKTKLPGFREVFN